MLHEVHWSEEELSELRRLVTHEWVETKDELHHTSSRDYKEKVKAHLELLTGMMRKLATSPTHADL